MFGGSKFPTFISYLTHVYGSLNAALSDTMNPKYYMSADVMLYVRACVSFILTGMKASPVKHLVTARSFTPNRWSIYENAPQYYRYINLRLHSLPDLQRATSNLRYVPYPSPTNQDNSKSSPIEL